MKEYQRAELRFTLIDPYFPDGADREVTFDEVAFNSTGYKITCRGSDGLYELDSDSVGESWVVKTSLLPSHGVFYSA
jgi:hypothetical protein